MILDVVSVVILLFSALVSLWRGLIREVLTIFGLVGGIIAAYAGGPLLIPLMRGWFGVEEGKDPEKLIGPLTYAMAADATAYASILVIVIILLSVISHFLAEFVRNIGLGALDRTLGVIFGIVRGALLLGLLYLPFSYLLSDEQKEEYLSDSKTLVYLEATAEWLAGFMPGEIEKALEDTAQKLEEANAARDKLEQMELLGDGGERKPGDQGAQEGYSQQDREDMDRLIEDSLRGNVTPAGNP